MHKGAPRHVQPHRFEEHLIAVGRSVNVQVPVPWYRGAFGFQQTFAAHQALRVPCSRTRDFSLFVRPPVLMGPAGTKTHGR